MKKKIFSVMLVALIALSSVMAAPTAGGVTGAAKADLGQASATADITLTLTEEDLASYSFGFSSNDNPASPSLTTAITLDNLGADFTATHTSAAYIFYNVRATKNFNIALSTTDALTGENSGKKVNFTVTVDDAAGIDTERHDLSWESNGVAPGAAALPIVIKTAAVPADGADTYKGQLTLTVTSL